MAAQEYYQSFQQRPQAPPYPSASFPSPQSYGSPYQQASHSSSSHHLKPPGPQYATPPTHSPQPQPQLQPQRQDYLAPVPYQQQPRPSPSQHLNLPSLAPTRSHSEPPESRRLSLEPHHHRHSHHHSRDHSRSDRSGSRSRSRSRSHDRGHSRSRSRNRSHSHHRHHHHHHSRSRARSTRDTFLGAGGGAIVGDVIFPGLGTLGGALLGGWGGHEYAKKRSKSDSRVGRDGITVRNGWVER